MICRGAQNDLFCSLTQTLDCESLRPDLLSANSVTHRAEGLSQIKADRMKLSESCVLATPLVSLAQRFVWRIFLETLSEQGASRLARDARYLQARRERRNVGHGVKGAEVCRRFGMSCAQSRHGEKVHSVKPF